MADISSYLNNIANAHYGEEVRGSIYNAIDLINKVCEGTLTIGTAITSTDSSSVDYFANSLYINSNTWDLWRCNSTGGGWTKMGNLLGSSIKSVTKTSTKSGTNNLVHIYTIYDSYGQSIGSFEVTNGNTVSVGKTGRVATFRVYDSSGSSTSVSLYDGDKINAGTGVTATNTSTTVDGVAYYQNDCYINSSTGDLWKCTGTGWTKLGNLIGPRGYSISSVTKTSTSGLVDTYTIKNTNNENVGTFTVTNGRSIKTVNKNEASSSGFVNVYDVFDDLDNKVGTFKVTDGIPVKETKLTSTEGLVDTYTVYDDNDKAIGTYTVTNGTSVKEIKKTSSDGFIDTYTIYNVKDEAVGTFTVSNGTKVKNITKKSSEGYIDTYQVNLDDETVSGEFTVSNGKSVRFYQGDIANHAKSDNVSTADTTKIYPSEDIRVGDILIAQWDTRNDTSDYKNYSVVLEFWQITAIDGGTATVTGLNEYPIEAGTSVTISKTDNETSILTEDASGSNTQTVKDGTKITVGNNIFTSTSSNVVDGVTYYANDLYINNTYWRIYRCKGTNSWESIGSIKGEQGPKMRVYIGTDSLNGNNVSVKGSDIRPGSSAYSIKLEDVVVSQTEVTDSKEYSIKLDFWEVQAITYASDKVDMVLLSSQYIKTGDKGDQGDSIESISLVTKNDRVATYKVNLDTGDSAGTFEVTDGAKGDKGDTGFAPTISISKSGIVTTVTITDVDGEHSFQIKDGESGDGSGDMLKSVYDSDGDGIIDENALPKSALGDMYKKVYDKNDDGIIDLDALPIATVDEMKAAIDAVRG